MSAPFTESSILIVVEILVKETRLVHSLSAPQIFIAYIFHTVSDKNLRHGKAGVRLIRETRF